MSRLGTSSYRVLPLVVLLGATGCDWGSKSPVPPAHPFKGVSIVAAAIGDPAVLPTLTAQRGEWSADRKAEVTIRDQPVDARSTAGVDLLVFRGERLGELIDAGLLLDLPESLVRPPAAPDSQEGEDGASVAAPPDPFRFADVAPAYRDQVAKYGNTRVALPYGGTALVLVYHRDAFENEANRAAAKEAKLELKPPETWEELDALARFFQGRDWNQDGRPDAGIALAFGPDPDGLGDATYLARAAGLGQHHDQYSFLFDADTMAARIDSPPFVEALEKLVALKAAGPDGVETFDAKAARQAFAERKAAFLIDRAERAASWGDGKAIGVAQLPGSKRVFDPTRNQYETVSRPNRPTYLPDGGGWLVAVCASSTGSKREAALDFAKYLVSPEVASHVRADPAFPILTVRSSLLSLGPPDSQGAKGVDSRQWSNAVGQTLLADRVVPGLRIPDAQGYLADLAKGRAAALQGESAQSALRGVAQAWNERSRRHGLKRQLWHYRRSLNSLATSPQPPAP